MGLVVAPMVRRRVVETGKNGVIVFTGLDTLTGAEIRITLLEKSGKRARMLIEAPDTVKIDHAG